MASIVSGIGLSTGLNITDTVNQLIAIQARPRDNLTTANTRLQAQQTALTALTAQLISTQITAKKFNSASLYAQRTVSSSDTNVLDVSSNGTPDLGSYQFTPLRVATAQQLQSTSFTSTSTAIGAGTLKFRFGGFINSGTSLDTLNSGSGFTAGKIRVTDRSGATADIDLTTARNIDEVLNAIGSNTTIKVTATTVNGALRLTDTSGGGGSLKVEELAGGTTAASLGLSGINVAANTANGTTIGQLFGDLGLTQLNDGLGVRFDGALPDLRVQLRDGTTSLIDFQKLASTGTFATATTTAANGANAAITLTAKTAGPDSGGFAVSFVDDPAITAGAETTVYDVNAKTLVFHIDAGTTTADQAIAALARNTTAAAAFSAKRATGGNGTGLVTATDAATTNGPPATITTAGVDSPNAKIRFTAVNGGPDYDNVSITFVDDPAVVGGSEIFTWDASDPDNKKLTIRIDQGNTNAKNIVDRLNADPTASTYFKAELADGATGLGKVVPADSTLTLGGALVAATPVGKQTTLQETVDLINAAAPGKLTASIVNNRLQLVDTSVDGGFDFEVEQLFGSKAAEDLGILGTAAGDTLTGSRIYSGLKTSLLSNLNGGAGIGTPGGISITDRSGASATVDLSAAETLDDVLESINAAGIGVRARYNSVRTGIELVDTTSSTAGNLIVTDADAQNTATKLGLIVDAATTTKNGGDLKLQIVNEATKLASLNGGAGVSAGTLVLTDNAGAKKTLTIDSNIVTVGDLIKKIGNLGLAIDARVNDAGDGIVLIDKTDGTGSTLAVTEGGGTTARDLHLLGGSKTATVDNVSKKIIDGSQTYSIELTATDTLTDLTGKINALNGRVRANVLNNGGTVKPFSFTLFNQVQGSAAQLLIDTGGVNFALNETVKGQDALLQIGGPGGSIAASSGNTFANILPETTLTVKGTSAAPVTVSVGKTTSELSTAVKAFVDSFNKVRATILSVSKYDTESNTAAILQGDGTVQRVENELASFASSRIFTAGPIQSLQQLGIGLSDTGTLVLDESKLNSVISERPDDVREFLSKENTGVGARVDKLVESLAGVGDSLIISRAAALSRKFDLNAVRIDFLTARLDRQKERLTTQFQNMELTISKIQSNSSFLQTLSQLAGQSTSS